MCFFLLVHFQNSSRRINGISIGLCVHSGGNLSMDTGVTHSFSRN